MRTKPLIPRIYCIQQLSSKEAPIIKLTYLLGLLDIKYLQYEDNRWTHQEGKFVREDAIYCGIGWDKAINYVESMKARGY